jgi:hypothetical protein
MSNDSRPTPQQELALRHVITSTLKQAIINSVPYLLIDDYIAASLTSKTHDYRDKIYYTSTVNAAQASEKAVINSLSGLPLGPGFNYYADALLWMVKDMIIKAFKSKFPELPLPKLEKYEMEGALEEVASLIYLKFSDEMKRGYDKGSIEAMSRLSAAELLLQVYIKFFEDLGVMKVIF